MTHSSPDREHADWDDADYQSARECMLEILRNNGWTIDPGRRDEKEFDNAFQHAVGILSLTARRAPAQAAGERVAWTNEAQLGFLKLPGCAGVPMAMWASPAGSCPIPLYAAPPQPAPADTDRKSLITRLESQRQRDPEMSMETERLLEAAAFAIRLLDTEVDNLETKIVDLQEAAAAPQGAWHTAESAPKDGKTFVAITYHGSFEDSVSWVAYWNGEHFEPTNAGYQIIDGCFTHWMIPDASSLSRPEQK